MHYNQTVIKTTMNTNSDSDVPSSPEELLALNKKAKNPDYMSEESWAFAVVVRELAEDLQPDVYQMINAAQDILMALVRGHHDIIENCELSSFSEMVYKDDLKSIKKALRHLRATEPLVSQ